MNYSVKSAKQTISVLWPTPGKPDDRRPGGEAHLLEELLAN
jgi:hypothetical protein